MTALKQIGNKMSLSDRAYEEIKRAIINGDIRQGEILTEEQLSNALGISRTPVRSAIKKVEFDDLVSINSSRNVVVVEITEKDKQDAFMARRLIEVEEAGILAEKITEEQYEALVQIVEKQKQFLALKSYSEFLDQEYEFHVKISEFCDNAWFYKMIKNIALLQRRILILSGHLERDWSGAIKEHETILEAFKKHDKEAAKQAMETHIVYVSERLEK